MNSSIESYKSNWARSLYVVYIIGGAYLLTGIIESRVYEFIAIVILFVSAPFVISLIFGKPPRN